MAHHGALKENQDIIEKLKPQYAVISTAKNDPNHPNKELIDLLVHHNVEFHRTDQDGGILVESNGKKITKIGTQ